MRVKRRIFSGAVCEQIVYEASAKANLKTVKPKAKPKTEEEKAKHNLAISRRKHAQLVNANFTPESFYSTLTFDMDNEVHDYIDCKKLRDLYERRLKRAFPDAVIYLYMGRGKTTHRFHLHMLSHGVTEEAIKAKWTYGNITRIEHLREHNYYDGVDHGQDYTGLANYLFDHWEPEQGSHRWKQTRNAKQPEKEVATVVTRQYSENKPPRPPKGYKLVECITTQYGYLYFKYVREDKPTIKRRRERQK